MALAIEFSPDMITEGKPEKRVQDQVEVPAVMTDPAATPSHDRHCACFRAGFQREQEELMGAAIFVLHNK